MAIEALLNAGRADRSRLEKFADGCTFLARAFWLGRTVSCSSKDDATYSVQTNYKEKTVTSIWMVCVNHKWDVPSPLFALVGLVSYAIAILPVSILMGIGLIAKKIVLTTDKNANLYHAIVQNALAYASQDRELRPLQSKLELDENTLNNLQKEQKDIEEVKISGESRIATSLKSNLSQQTMSIAQNIKSVTDDIEFLKPQIVLKQKHLEELKTKVENSVRALMPGVKIETKVV